MKILDRYLFIEFWKFFLISLIAVVSMYLIINVFEKLTYFLHYHTPPKYILLYYLYSLPSFVSLLIPVGTILSIFLVIGRMVKNNELRAVISSGILSLRAFTPLFICGGIVGGSHFLNDQLVTPKASSLLYELNQTKIKKQKIHPFKKANLFYHGEQGWVFFIQWLDGESKIAKNLTLWKINKDRKIEKRIDTKMARFVNNRWKAEEVTIRYFLDDLKDSVLVKNNYILKELNFTPEDMLRRPKNPQEMNALELSRFIKKLRNMGIDVKKERVNLNFMFSFPFINIIMLMIALSLSSKLRKGGVTFGIGLGFLVSFLYWGAIQMFKAFGYAGILSPFVAAWAANFIFGIVGMALSAKIET